MLASIASGLIREQSVTSTTQSDSEESTARPIAGAGSKRPERVGRKESYPVAASAKELMNNDEEDCLCSKGTDDGSGCVNCDSRRHSRRLLGIKSLLRESSRALSEGLVEEQKSTDHLARGEKYDGPYLNGQRHGDGVVCTMADGTKFLGSYRHDEPVQGTMISDEYTYSGPLFCGKFHGSEGKLALADGSTYEGEFRCGIYHGAGKLILPNGSTYTGTFENGKRHGIGTLLRRSASGGDIAGENYADGPSYSGEWADDLRHGEGTEKLATGDIYRGNFSLNKPHGAGSLTGSDGVVREGVWRNGVPVDGPGWTITYPSGDKYVGCTANMRPHGIGTLKYNSEQRKGVYNGEFERGKRHGMGLLVFNDGEQFDGLWVDDNPGISKKASGKVEILTRLRQTCDDGGDFGDDLISAVTMEEHRALDEEYGEVHDVGNACENKKSCSSDHKSFRPSFFSLKDELVEPSLDAAHAVASNEITTSEPEISEGASPKRPLHRFVNGDTFHGQIDARGQKQGRGVYIESETGTTYEGHFQDDMRHGHGILISSESKFDGFFVNDEREGHGTLVLNESVSYRGTFKGGKYHGTGTLCDGDGRVYVGQFRHGMFDGHGSMTYPDGSVYSGGWKQGKRSGSGTLKEGGVDGRTLYEGLWHDDLRHGKGRNYYVAEAVGRDSDAPCARFDGPFEHNQREGIGRYIFPDGVVTEGPYHCNRPVDGDWSIRQPDGTFFTGKATWNDGAEDTDTDIRIPIPHGFGAKTYSNGDNYKGHFARGVRHGIGKCVFENGDTWEGRWFEDKFDDGCIGTLRLADGSRHPFGHEYSTIYRDDSSRQS